MRVLKESGRQGFATTAQRHAAGAEGEQERRAGLRHGQADRIARAEGRVGHLLDGEILEGHLIADIVVVHARPAVIEVRSTLDAQADVALDRKSVV